jgi:hypothetical protein
MGNIARTLVKEGKLGISSRGLGTVAEDGYVNEDFNLITWDLVTDPSNKPSWVNGIYEGQEFQMIGTRDKEVNSDDIKKAQKAYFNYLMETLDEISVQKQQAIGAKSDEMQKYLRVISQWALEAANYANFGDMQTAKGNIKKIEKLLKKLK